MVTSRIWFTASQKIELWECWKQGQSISAISRALERRNNMGVQTDRGPAWRDCSAAAASFGFGAEA